MSLHKSKKNSTLALPYSHCKKGKRKTKRCKRKTEIHLNPLSSTSPARAPSTLKIEPALEASTADPHIRNSLKNINIHPPLNPTFIQLALQFVQRFHYVTSISKNQQKYIGFQPLSFNPLPNSYNVRISTFKEQKGFVIKHHVESTLL